MQKVEVFTGVAVPFRRSNVDTDQIIPAVYLKRITKTGFEDALFASWRADKDFVLNQDAYKNAEVLIAGQTSAPAHRASTRFGRFATTVSKRFSRASLQTSLGATQASKD